MKLQKDIRSIVTNNPLKDPFSEEHKRMIKWPIRTKWKNILSCSKNGSETKARRLMARKGIYINIFKSNEGTNAVIELSLIISYHKKDKPKKLGAHF